MNKPTMEEIAEWLREAGVHEANVHLHRGGTSEEADAIQEVWNKRAVQVEAMRCETCKRDHYCQHAYSGGGCFSHEQKTLRLRRG